jgi:hypothetical protein
MYDLNTIRSIYMHRPEQEEDRVGLPWQLWGELRSQFGRAGFMLTDERSRADALFGFSPVLVYAPKPVRISAVFASLSRVSGVALWENSYWPFKGMSGLVAREPTEAILLCASRDYSQRGVNAKASAW